MITILIVDDQDEKVVEISRIIRKFEIPTSVIIASDIINARRSMNENNVDILVLDLFLPIRYGDSILDNGGLLLLKEIQKGKFSSIPKIIFGLTIADHLAYDGFWPFFKYDSNNTWITPFKLAFNHVKVYQKIYNDVAGYFGFEIYLEGKTDFTVFEKCRSLFFDDRRDIVFRFESGAGASWVTRQILAHCMMLPCDQQTGKPVRCAGVYDNDYSGQIALSRIDTFLLYNAAERKHFKTFVVKKSYSPVSKCLLADGEYCELEDLYCVSLWLWASNNGFLNRRDIPRKLIENDISKILGELCYMEQLSEEECSEFLKVYSEFEISHEHKGAIISHWLSMDDAYIKKTMLPIKLLLNDIINYCDS